MSEFAGPVRNSVPVRLDWVDTAKGFCIILVVLMHVVAGFEVSLERTNWIDPFIDWAKLFRMPGFFLLSGLFVSRLVERDWPEFLDRKIAPFVYFYLLWLAINCVLKFPTWGDGDIGTLLGAYALGIVQPFGILWFIYLLAGFFAVTKLVRYHPLVTWLAAAALALVPVETGWLLVDRFAEYYVFFLSGALFASKIFAMADWVRSNRGAALLFWLAWVAVTAFLTSLGGYAAIYETPGAALILGHAGALGIITLSVFLAGRVGWLDYCGRNSLPIYLAFFIPMALTRVLLIKSGLSFDAGEVSLLLTVVCVIVPLAVHKLLAGTPLAFLFERPRAFRIAPRRAASERAVASGRETVSGGVSAGVNAPAGR